MIDCASSSGLFLSATHRSILMAASKSRLTNAMCLLLLVDLISARIPRTRALCVVTVSSSSRWAKLFSRLYPLVFIVVTTCSCSVHGRREEDCFVSSSNLAMTAVQDLRISRPYLSLGFFFVFENERTSNPSAIQRENPCGYTHLIVEHD